MAEIWNMFTNNGMLSDIQAIFMLAASAILAFVTMANIDKIFGTKETREAEMEYRIWKKGNQQND
jgi:hypothetical protein